MSQMSEQDGTQSSTKQRRSRKTNLAIQENGKHTPAAQRPANDDAERIPRQPSTLQRRT